MELNGRPGDQRGFLHKKILGIAKHAIGLVPGGNIIKTGLDLIPSVFRPRPGGGLPGLPQFGTTPIPLVTNLSPVTGGAPIWCPGCIWLNGKWIREAEQFALGLLGGNGAPSFANGGGHGTCKEGLVWDEVGQFCTFPGGPRFTGEVKMGKYGAAMVPEFVAVNTRKCIPGDLLGNDGLCYNRASLKNSERMWPRGRRPLLTGGEMRAISIANTAANKLQKQQKRLRDMGMLPALPKRKALPPARITVREAGPGGVVVQP